MLYLHHMRDGETWTSVYGPTSLAQAELFCDEPPPRAPEFYDALTIQQMHGGYVVLARERQPVAA